MPDTFFLPFWIYFLPSPPCLWPLWDGLGTTSTGPLTFCFPVAINKWEARAGDGWKETEWDPWTYSPGSLLLNFPRYNHSFFKVSSSAGLCLSSTDVPFSHFSGSRLITTHFIAPNSHNLITLLKYFHFCILFIWFLNATIYFHTWKHWTWRNMTIKFKVTQPVASQWMTVGRNQNIPLPGTEASLKQIKQTKRWRRSLDHRAGSSVGLTWKIGGGGVQPLLSGMCLFSPLFP